MGHPSADEMRDQGRIRNCEETLVPGKKPKDNRMLNPNMLTEPAHQFERVEAGEPAQAGPRGQAVVDLARPSNTSGPAESERSADVIDRVHLARYTMGDIALEAEILVMFADQLDEMLGALETARDANTWNRAAHTLKGSSRAIGAWALAEMAAKAEEIGYDAATTAEQLSRDQVISTLKDRAIQVKAAVAMAAKSA